MNVSDEKESYQYYYNFQDNYSIPFGICNYEKFGAVFLPGVYSVLFIFGLVANALVFWVMLKAVKLCTMTDVCLLNLAIADLLLLGSLPFLAFNATDQWVFGLPMCKLILGSYYMGFYSGIFFITLMSIDRYLAVVHAVYALRARTRTLGVIASLVVWIIALLASFPEILFIKVSRTLGWVCSTDYTENSPLRQFAIFKMNLLGLVVPLAILFFCYSMIIRTLLNSRSSKRKTIRLVMVVVVAFFCCWMPYNVARFFEALELLEVYSSCSTSKAIRLSLQVTEAVAYTHSCLNPILYVFLGEKFRERLLKQIIKVPCLRKTLIHIGLLYTTPMNSSQQVSRTENSAYM